MVGEYWSGYYTSRVALKWVVRANENFLRTAEILNVLLTTKNGQNKNYLNALDRVTKSISIF